MKRALVLRAQEDAARTAEKLRGLGYEAIVSPVIEIAATGAAIPAGAYDAVIATSAKGVEHAGDLSVVKSIPFHAVGAKTAEAARQRGLTPDLVAGNFKALLPLLRERYAAPAHLLYLAGRERQPDLESGLAEQGHAAALIETYDARAARSLTQDAIAAIGAGEIAFALHYSRRSVEIFLKLADAAGLARALPGIAHLALSDDVAEPLRRRGLEPQVAGKPDEAHLLRLLE